MRFILTLLAAFLASICLHGNFAHAKHHPEALETTIYTTKGELQLNLELAADNQSRAVGLMHRQSLKESDGMIFLFPKAVNAAFWMKNTFIPLDMLFVDDDYKIIHIVKNASPHSLTPRSANQKVIAVIEIAGGRAEREGIVVGDIVRYSLPESREIR
jgi:uncharacterized membrane protein (UPF0127 family)